MNWMKHNSFWRGTALLLDNFSNLSLFFALYSPKRCLGGPPEYHEAFLRADLEHGLPNGIRSFAVLPEYCWWDKDRKPNLFAVPLGDRYQDHVRSECLSE